MGSCFLAGRFLKNSPKALPGRLAVAALPPRCAVRLCLTVESLNLIREAAPPISEAQPQREFERCCRKGKAFPHIPAAEPQERGASLLPDREIFGLVTFIFPQRCLSKLPFESFRGEQEITDGQTLASGGVDGLVRLWDAETGQLRCARACTFEHVKSIACHRWKLDLTMLTGRR